MTEQENRRVYETLLTTLSENSLVWVIQQVEEQVRLGKVIEREIETFTDVKGHNSVGNSRFKKGPKVKLPVTIAYSYKEKLEILIEAIKCALIDTADMEDHLIHYLGREVSNVGEIRFYDDDAEQVAQIVNHGLVSMRSQDVDKLKKLLELLRKEINNN